MEINEINEGVCVCYNLTIIYLGVAFNMTPLIESQIDGEKLTFLTNTAKRRQNNTRASIFFCGFSEPDEKLSHFT